MSRYDNHDQAQRADRRLVLDSADTRIGFVARAMATRVRGQFDGFEGTAHLDGDDPSKCSAQLTLQATSIQTRNHRRDNHLRGSFLEADTYPTISFTSTNVEQFDETSYQVSGDLTIRGVAKRVTLNFELADAEKRPTG